jgi:hypothetical protein
LVEVVAAREPDLVVIDAMFASALNVAPQFGRPTAVMLHTFLYRLMDIWRANFTMQSESRQRAGLGSMRPASRQHPTELSVPANAWLTPFADYDPLLDRAAFVVGHGTTMRALRHCRPIVAIPALAVDRVPITQLIEAWGAGRGLPTDADTDQIRAAAR